jgi:succinate dehydrogenase / fumarate reductase cytochrome b subunit
MIGPYYRPQLTSMLSITHRATGVLLGLAGAPLLLLWIIAVSRGPESLESLYASLGSLPGKLLSIALLFSLSFHFFNGIRHLIWDTGRMLKIETAYRAGWTVLILSMASTLSLAGVLL